MIKMLIGAAALALVTGAASAATYTFTASLDAAQEVPPSTSSATGMATFTVDEDTQILGFMLDVDGISVGDLKDVPPATPKGPVHLHAGVSGANGPIVIPFLFGAGGYVDTMTGFSLSRSEYAFADALVDSGGSVDFDVFVSALQAGDYYVNVHTNAFAGGEIRGQLAPVPVPAAGLLILTGFGALGAMRRRRKASAAA